MKKNPPPPRSLTALLLALAAGATAAAALTPTEWQFRQPLTVAAPGLVRVPLTAATFDHALPGLADLRLLDPNAQEVAYLLDRDLSRAGQLPPLEEARRLRPREFRVSSTEEATQLVLATGTVDQLDAVELETSTPYFLKAAHVEISADGQDWQSLGSALPLFRQFGAEQLRLPLNRRAAAFVRVTLDDFHTRPIEFTGARIQVAPARAAAPALVPVGARISRREEYAGKTVLTLELDGRRVPLGGLTLLTSEPLFMRAVTVAVREASGGQSRERPVGSGTIYRVALDGSPVQAQTNLAFDFAPETRELLVTIQNGDSPPLAIDGVEVSAHPVNLYFRAAGAGSYALLTGNPQANAAHYDLAAFTGEIRSAVVTVTTPGEPEVRPDYHARDSLAEPPLPDIPLTGAPLVTRDWPRRKIVQLARPGVQELELDLETLAAARPDYADVRLLREGNQVPYLLEQPALSRSLVVAAVAVPDPKRPAVSVWRVTLPQARLPVRRVILNSSTTLFQRQIRVYGKVADSRGAAGEITLAEGGWSRTPAPGAPESRAFDLMESPAGDTLWIETDNGDNPALALGPVQLVLPVVRLVFKAAATDGFTLAYGNPSAAAPSYDLSLVATRLLTASRSLATIAAGDANPAAAGANLFGGLNRTYIFWAALALVVVVLLATVAKLLPKPPAAK